MKNPWSALPKAAPYALASDAALLQSFIARGVAPKHRYDTSLFPEPPPAVTGLQLLLGPSRNCSRRCDSCHALCEPVARRCARTRQLRPFASGSEPTSSIRQPRKSQVGIPSRGGSAAQCRLATRSSGSPAAGTPVRLFSVPRQGWVTSIPTLK